MVADDTERSTLAAFEPLIASIAEWARLCRIALGARDELAVTSPEDVARIAGELGVQRPDLARAEWPRGSDLMRTP